MEILCFRESCWGYFCPMSLDATRRYVNVTVTTLVHEGLRICLGSINHACRKTGRYFLQ